MFVALHSALRKLVFDESIPFRLVQFENKTVLDVGCGYGYYTYRLAKLFPNSGFTGLDVNKRRIETAKKTFKLPNLKFVYRNAQDFNLETKFDIIIALDIFHHIPYNRQARVLDKIVGHLRGGGTLLIKDINGDSRLACFNTLHDALLNKTFIRKYRSISGWKALLRMNNFNYIKIVPCRKLLYPHVCIVAS